MKNILYIFIFLWIADMQSVINIKLYSLLGFFINNHIIFYWKRCLFFNKVNVVLSIIDEKNLSLSFSPFLLHTLTFLSLPIMMIYITYYYIYDKNMSIYLWIYHHSRLDWWILWLAMTAHRSLNRITMTII